MQHQNKTNRDKLYDLQLEYDAIDRAIIQYGHTFNDAKAQSYYRRRYRLDLELQSLKILIQAEYLAEATLQVENELIELNNELKSKI